MGVQKPLNPPVNTFFTNKIPCTLDDWFDTLVVVASVYDKFDGREYNRENILKEFAKIATRNEQTTRDPSDFRDEYGAYGSYLGIFFVKRGSGGHLICHTTRAAKELLCSHNPDPEAFCRLQMALYQYPDGTGIVYQKNPHMQANSLNSKINQIKADVLFAPFRIILHFLLYLHEREELRKEAYLTYEEIYFLFNHPNIYTRNYTAFPSIIMQIVENRGEKYGQLPTPNNFKRNFHILEMTGLIKRVSGRLVLDIKSYEKINAAKTIANLDTYFDLFSGLDENNETFEKEIIEILISGKWGYYYDGFNLDYDTYFTISKTRNSPQKLTESIQAAPFSKLNQYKLFRFPGSANNSPEMPQNYAKAKELREKRNVRHREINDILAKKLIGQGINVFDNQFVDLVANFENADFIFEVKTVSTTDFLERVREAISQLFEYRYRSKQILSNPILIVLLERDFPNEYDWMKGYLNDLGIIMCWMNDGMICSNKKYKKILGSFIDSYF
ncbi:hypothetical protein KAR91_56715 [Candidatus Pacearchaeota archaeon]|nr:hypothetical protein [Candidatus Pacearchaeota archaeon]